jgi:hypothetical protein
MGDEGTVETPEVEVEVVEAPSEIATTQEVEATPDPTTASQDTVEVASPAEPPTPHFNPAEFEWDAWDGETNALPEPIRPWAEAAIRWQDSRLQPERERIEQLQELYQGLMDGIGDPRVGTLTEEKTSLQAEFEAYKTDAEAWKTERDTSVAELQEREAKWAAHQEKQLKTQVDEWQQANKWIFEKKETRELGSELLTEDWQYQLLPKLLKLPKALLAEARELNKSNGGQSQELVLELVLTRATHKVTNASTSLVSGTETPQVTAQRTTAPDPSRMSGNERMLEVIRDNMQRTRSG